jgi:hypothetical protein
MNRAADRTLQVLVVAACLGTAFVAATQGLGAFGNASGPPEPAITDAPLRPTIATSATFGFVGLASSFECSIDDADYRRCASPVTYRGLELGAHRFRVRGRDAVGTVGEPAQYTWQIVEPARAAAPAGVVPRPVMVTVPVKPWVSRSATFSWDRRGAASSQCSLDGSSWRACTSPKRYRGLALGKHAFAVRGITGAQHSSVNQFHWTITEGTPPPPPVLTGAPGSDTTSTEAVFSFDVPAGMEFQCSLDSSDWQPCSSPTIYVGLGVGSHTFCARSVSPTGIPSLPTCTTWVIHAVEQPPVTPPPPPGQFTITGDQPVLLAPGLGGPVPVTITNPQSFPITVTGLVLTVASGSSKPGCDGASNLSVAQSNLAGGAVSVVVPAGGSVLLPAQGATAPVVTMLDLGSNQDTCKGATFTFDYAAMGTG